MRSLGVLAAVVVSLAACGTAGAQPLQSGISGRVLAGPTCPVERFPPRPQCAPRPLAASLRIRRVETSSASKLAHSGANGRFRVLLPPGVYIIHALSENGSPFPRPPADSRVQVRRGHLTRVTISYDTGIR